MNEAASAGTTTALFHARELALPGMLSIQPLVHADERGRLIKLLHQGAFHELGLPEVFAELVVSESAARVVRGLQ